LEKQRDQQASAEPKTSLVEQINLCLHSGDYSRALELLRSAAAEFPNDAELRELERLAQEGARCGAEASRLITESQELFAERKSAEAIQLLRKAHELDKNNALARAILANALVEHAHSLIETDWREAETLAKQALSLNPSHPTAKTIRSLILDRKKASPVEEWVAQASKLQSSGDLFAALARVEEGMDIYPNNPKLLQVQDAIQRDQNLRRRQARRRDLEDLRRMELEIDAAADDAAKKTLADRIQRMAASYWTDGEIISVANALLHRLGLVSPVSSTASHHAAVIFNVPPRNAPKPARTDSGEVPHSPPSPNPLTPGNLPTVIPPSMAQPTVAALSTATSGRVVESVALQSTLAPPVEPKRKIANPPVQAKIAPPPASATEPSAPATRVTSRSAEPTQLVKSNSKTLILVSCAAIVLLAIAATFFFTRKHQPPSVAQPPAAAPAVSAPVVSTPVVSVPANSAPGVSTQAAGAPPITPETSPPAPIISSDAAVRKMVADDRTRNDRPHDVQPPAESTNNLGTLVVVTGQNDAKVFLNGKLQPQLTRAGQLRLPNLELKDYVVQVSKSGFQDPPQQKIRIRNDEPGRVVFNLQALPRLASLTIQGGAPGTTVLVDQALVGTIQPDGSLSVSTVNPGDHTVELRKEKFKPRQFKKHFVVGGTVSLAAADAALEAAAGELKISYSPPDATVALVKGDLLKIVGNGVPLNLAPGTYTLTARTAERFTRSSTLEVVAGQSRTVDLSLAPNGMSKWDDAGAWKHEGESFIRKGGDFVLYGVVPTSGTFAFSAAPTKGRILQWVLNYSDPKNYIFFQMDDKAFYRTVIHNGEKKDEVIVPNKDDKKSLRTIQVRVGPTEIIHEVKQGNSWTVLDRWVQPGTNLTLGKFGFYIPGSDQVALSSFSHYADLNIR
jgi:tetratricopeptide (TPR) repeat protein